MTPTPRPRVRRVSSLSSQTGAMGLSRRALVMLLTAIHVTLPGDAVNARQDRVPGRPACFYWRATVQDNGAQVVLHFVVGDAGWPDEIWVIEVERLP